MSPVLSQSNFRAVHARANRSLTLTRATRPVVQQLEGRMLLSGTLDPNFSGDGKQTVNFTGTSVDSASAVAVQKDGKIVIAGTYTSGTNSFFAVSRLNVDGSLDTSFTDATTGLAAGRTAVRFGGASSDLAVATSLAIQADGKIVVAGYTNVINGVGAVGGSDFAVARFNTNGTLDTTFSSDGRATFDTGTFDRAFAVAIDGNQKIVVAGSSFMSSEAQTSVIRLTSTGGLDSSFNGSGINTFGIGSFPLFTKGVAIQSTGNIVIVGQEVDSSTSASNPFAVRILANGQSDTSFGTGSGGFDSILQLNYPAQAIATSVAIDSSDRIVFGGIYSFNSANDAMAGRLDANGNIDGTFAFANPNNLFIRNVSGNDGINSVTITPTGNIMLGGFAQGAGNRTMLAIELDSTGVTTGFNVTGVATVDIAAGDDSANGVAVQPDGKVVLAGNTAASSDMAIARLTGTGFLLIRGTNGADTISFNGNSYTLNGITAPIDTSYVTAITIFALGGTDTINVNSSLINQAIALEGDAGSNTYNVGGGNVSNLKSGIEILGTPGATETLNIDDHLATAAGAQNTFDAGSFHQDSGPAISYDGMTFVNATLGNRNQGIAVHSTSISTTTKIIGGTGEDFFEVGSTLTLADDLPSKLIVDGGGGTNDHVSLNNDQDPFDDDITVAGNVFTIAGTNVNVTILNMETEDFNLFSDTVKIVNASTSTLIGATYSFGGGNDSFTGGNQGEIVNAGAGSDNIHGGGGNDNLSGEDGDDQLFGDAGNDTLAGSFGNDTLDGGEGNDQLDGADDSDSYNFSNATAAQTDTINDVTDAGINTLNFASMTNAVTINLSSNTLATMTNRTVNTASAGLFATLQQAFGGSGADSITGNDLDNTLRGNAGNDTLTGGKGSDFLRGDANDDKYVFANATSAETDNVAELAEVGNDTLDFSAVTTGVTVSLASATLATHTNRTVTNFFGASTSVENAIGGSGADSLTGSSVANTLTGNAGNDTLTGGDGNDSLVGGDNNDTYKFAAASAAQTDTINETSTGGIDTLDVSALTTSVTVNLGATTTATHTNRTVNSASGATTNIENATGGSGADSITGNASSNTLIGNVGNDSLFGLAGDDSLSGGNDQDALDGGEGSDKLDGGNLSDRYVFANASAAQTDTISEPSGEFDAASLDFSALTVPVTVNLNSATIATHANRTVTFAAGTAGNAILSVLGGSGNDTITGLSASNPYHHEFFGNGGNDSIVGGEGTVDSLVGGDGNDTLIGGSTQDNMYGNAGDDSMVGNGGGDLMYAGNFDLATGLGNDTLDGGEGSDTMFGTPGNTTYKFANASAAQTDQILELLNTGTDTLDFSAMTQAVSVNLAASGSNATFATMTNRTIQDLGNTAPPNIENIIGGSAGDTLIGNALANSITGNAGNDTITGGEGSDTLVGGANDDKYIFATASAAQTDKIAELAAGGTDTMDFSGLSTAVNVNLLSDNLATHTNRTVQTLVAGQFANIENAIGGSAGDTLIGNSLPNSLVGNGGNDSITGNEGNDTAVGGAGADTYKFATPTAAQTDTITDAAGDNNVLDFSLSTSAVTINLQSTTTVATQTNRTVNGSGPWFLTAIGGSGADVINGNTSANTLIGNAGDDKITGRGLFDGGEGSDTLTGSFFDDTYRFSNATAAQTDRISEPASGGIDTLDFSGVTVGVNANIFSNTLATHTNRTVTTLVAGQFANIENINGGSAGDTLTGNSSNNVLNGNAGADSLVGNLGNDSLNGGEGNDTAVGGDGSDTYIFNTAFAAQTDRITEITNNGTDTLDFSGLTTAVTVNLGSDTLATHTNRTVLTSVAGQFINIENANGGSGNDTITGNSGNNALKGNAGNDSLVGSTGNDSLTGGTGNDTMIGGDGNDSYIFQTTTTAEIDTVSEIANNGTDTIDCSAMTTAANINLGIGTLLSDLFRLVPTLVAGQSANFENANGGSGSDTIVGNNSNNTLLGGAGNDSITALLGADLLDGGEGNDTLLGGDGNDVYRFGQPTAAQTDVVGEITNNGIDTLDFSQLNSTTPVVVNLLSDTLATHTNRTVKTQIAGQFVNIENATGGAGADKLTGNNIANTLIGNAGNDTLTGNGAADNLQGGNDIDTFFALDGLVDSLDGGLGADVLGSSDASDLKSNIP